MDGYEIEKIDEGLWAIDDKMGCSMYLVEGRNKALLVDTGVQEGKILPMLKSLTDKPISLALTHAHIVHSFGHFGRKQLHRLLYKRFVSVPVGGKPLGIVVHSQFPKKIYAFLREALKIFSHKITC